MQATIEALSASEKLSLIRFCGTDAYNALRSLIDAERLALAKDHVDQVDINQVRYLSGQCAGLAKLVGTLQHLQKEGLEHKQAAQKR